MKYFLFFLSILNSISLWSQDSIASNIHLDIQNLLKEEDPLVIKRYTDLGAYYFNLGQLDSCSKYDRKAIQLAKHFEEKNKKNSAWYAGMANAYRGLSEVARLTGKEDSSHYFAWQSIQHAENTSGEYRGELGISYHLLALYYYDRGLYDSALVFDNKAIDIVRTAKDTSSIINYLNAISLYYQFLGQEHISVQKLREARLLAIATKDIENKVYINLGLSQKETNDENRKNLLIESLKDSSFIKDNYLRLKLFHYLGRYFLQKNQTDTAFYFLNRSERVAIQTEDFVSLAEIWNEYSSYFIKNKQLENAANYLDTIHTIANRFQNANLLRMVYQGKIQLFQTTEDWELALKQTIQLNQLNDSLANEKVKKEAFDRELKYQLDLEKVEFEKEKVILEQEKQFQQLIILLLVLLFIIISLSAYFLLKRNKELKLRNEKIAEQSKEIQLKTQETIAANEAMHQLKLKQKQRDLEHSIASNKLLIEMKGNLVEKLEELLKIKEAEKNTSLKSLILEMKVQLEMEKKLEIMEANNELINSAFYEKLRQFGKLSKTEQEVSSYIRLGLSTKEIAEIRGSTNASVRVSRSRIREKLGLIAEDNLYEFLGNL